MKGLEKVLAEYQKSKEPVSVVYKTHTSNTIVDSRNIIEEFNKRTGFVQIGHYKKLATKKDPMIYSEKDAIIYTTMDEISRIIVLEE